jgi:hypothetical protein
MSESLKLTLAIEAPDEAVVALAARLKAIQAEAEPDLKFSAPVPARRTGAPLDSPIGGEEILAALKVITIVFGAGSAVLKFRKEIITLAQEKGWTFLLRDARTGSVKGKVGPKTTVAELERMGAT